MGDRDRGEGREQSIDAAESRQLQQQQRTKKSFFLPSLPPSLARSLASLTLPLPSFPFPLIPHPIERDCTRLTCTLAPPLLAPGPTAGLRFFTFPTVDKISAFGACNVHGLTLFPKDTSPCGNHALFSPLFFFSGRHGGRTCGTVFTGVCWFRCRSRSLHSRDSRRRRRRRPDFIRCWGRDGRRLRCSGGALTSYGCVHLRPIVFNGSHFP